ncbi:MAG: CHAT domain-containing protein [Cyanobacteria bacterium P01_C01_bin.121]
MTERLQRWTVRVAKLCAAPVTWIAGVAAILSPAGQDSVKAQVVATPEGAGTTVTESGDQFDIAGGTQAGGNLFHEFDQFDLSASQTANFAADSGVFNIVGQISEAAPSYIDGTVQVSGSDADLYLINPSGILFGENAQLSLNGSFTATTADQVEFDGNVLNALAQTNDYSELTAEPSALHFTSESAGAVVNKGDLAVDVGESIALVGGTVVNTGSISAPGGEVALVAVGGDHTIKLAAPGSLLSMEVTVNELSVEPTDLFEPTDLPEMLTGNSVEGADSLVVNDDGSVSLRSSKSSHGDNSIEDVVVESGAVVASGELSTASETGDGGTVALLGESVKVVEAQVETSGDRGGRILIGGDFKGEGTLLTSAQTVVDADSVLIADGHYDAGGEIVVWADDTAAVHGQLSVRGATEGGSVETSAQYLDISEVDIDVSGKAEGGSWVIDPVDYEVVASGAGTNQINAATIESTLDMGGDVVVMTSGAGTEEGDIQLQTSINQTNAASNGSLRFEGRRFVDNGHEINLASSGQLTFDINSVNPEVNPDSSSIQSAISAIGNVNGRRLIRLGAANYDFDQRIVVDTDVEIEGTDVSTAVLATSTADERTFLIASDVDATFRDLTFTTSGLMPGEAGGGLANYGMLTVENSLFVDNRAVQNGGAIDSFNGGAITVSNSTFRDNTSAVNGSGGAIHLGNVTGISRIHNTLFENNNSYNGGGAINASNADLVVDSGSRFVSNMAANGGGAIANYSSANALTINSASFDSNISQSDGGALFAKGDAAIEIIDSHFSGNRAEGSSSDGGAIAIGAGTSILRLSDTAITDNFAQRRGGGLFLEGDTTATISGTLTTDAAGRTTSATTRFVNNETLEHDGGGISAIGTAQLNVSEILLRDNSAGDDGGGISISFASTAIIDNTNFENNSATEMGGGLYSNNTQSVSLSSNKVEVTNSRFIENESGISGGGFFQGLSGTAVLRENLFQSNQAAVDGGGIHISASNAVIENSRIIDNAARFGGGVEVSLASDVRFTNSTLRNNRATRLGGGVQVDDNSIVRISESTFEGNQAVSGGGLSNIGTSELVNTTLSGNTASQDGGAIWVYDGARLTILNSTVTANSAGTIGSGIAETNSQSQIQNTIIAANLGSSLDVSGRFNDAGNNLIGKTDGTNGFTQSALIGTAANPIASNLAGLADNGGPTKTHLPLATSVAIDAGGASNLPVSDQRGQLRVLGSAADIGAVELTEVERTSLSVGGLPQTGLPIDPTLSATEFAELDGLLAIRTKQSLSEAESSIRRLESSFSRSYEDYWDLSAGPETGFSNVQAILRRAQDEYKVNSAVIYATFAPEDPAEEDSSTILRAEPAAGDDDLLNLSIVLPEGELVSYQLPVTRKEALRQVRYFRTTASDEYDALGYRPLAQQMYQWLLAPLEEDLAAQNIHNLMYALDSGLRTVPIAAMRDDDGFSLERYGISMVPSVGLMQADFPVAVRRSTVAMGVSEFDSQSPLPAVPIELDVVDQFVPVSNTVLNESTTIDALKVVQALEQPGILHLATHASFDRRSPEDSLIHLWDEPLSMKEFSTLDWRNSDLEMLILSACSTALGSRNSELGFAGLAAASGVDATVGSLWDVSDVGTLALMGEFYAQLEKTDLRFEALRQAQLALLNGETRIENGNLKTSRGEVALPDEWNMPDAATLDHPFFWSAFSMVGNPW